jgi:AcrR family transcriptional regulator
MFPNMQYRSSVSDSRGELVVPAGQLPAGRHSLTREVVLASQRGRVLDAMAQAVAQHGYGETTVAHVVALAGVSRKTFYQHFTDKEGCFLALYDTGIAYVLGRIAQTLDEPAERDPLARVADPLARVAVGLRAFLAVLAEEPDFSRAIILEVHAAGAEALRRRRATLEEFARRYEDINGQARAQDPSIPVLSHDIALALVGAILELVTIRIEDGRTAQLVELSDSLTEFVAGNVAPGRLSRPPSFQNAEPGPA